MKEKLIFTFGMLVLFRLGIHLPLFGINNEYFANLASQNNILGFLDLFSGGALGKVSIFALGIGPYITSSIIMQLMAVIIPALEKLQKEAKKTRTKSDCESEISACLVLDNACSGDYRNCEENADFDKFFAACGVQATGCDNFISEIRGELLAERDNAIENADEFLAKIVATYQNARENKLANIRKGCEEDTEYESCVETVCQNNMPDKCADSTEKVSAGLLCQFYKTACKTLR